MLGAGQTYSIPGVYRRPKARAEGLPRVRTDVAGFVGVAGPRHLGKAVAVDDWKGWVAQFRRDEQGAPIDAPPGAMLESAVRDFFANGGRRVWIVNVAEKVVPEQPQRLLNDLLGLNQDEPGGLELLLRQDEVAIVALPDLDAEVTVPDDRAQPIDLPGKPCFMPCVTLAKPGGSTGPGTGGFTVQSRLFSNDDLMWAQRYLINRLLRERWRWFALLAPPPGRTAAQAVDWRERLTRGSEGADVAALYWPWLIAQDSPGAPTQIRSPVGAVAGIFALVDIETGPQSAPANRRLTGVVGLQSEIGDEENGFVYDAGVNVVRAFPGEGIQLWGARTLLWRDRDSRAEPLAFVNARRCLSAIARTCEFIGRPLVFEPNDFMLRIKLHQLMIDYLMRVFQSGALKGDQPEQGFFVAVETVGDSPESQLICRIGVALAAPAEFITFRIGREGGVIELEEAA